MKFNDLLPQLRASHQLSQEALAEKLHVSRQAVAKWESGTTMPDLTNLMVISDLFHVSLDRLLKDQKDSCGISILARDYEMDQGLVDFLFDAKLNTYALGAAEVATPSRPSAHDLAYESGNLRYMDTYLGSEKFSGQEAVWKGETAIWTMNYIGRVLEDGFSGDFLKRALTEGIRQKLVRGPELFSEGDHTFHCDYKGDMTWFRGNESIFYLNRKVYECYFHGGIVKE